MSEQNFQKISYKLKPSTLLYAGFPFLLGLVFIALALPEVLNESKLREHGKQVLANVIDSRITKDRKRQKTNYELKYSFTLPFSSELYNRSDVTGRRDLWSTLPREQWDNARATGSLLVVYLPKNPWINHPCADPNQDPEGGLLVGGITMLGTVFILGIAYMERRKLALAQRTGQILTKEPSWNKIQPDISHMVYALRFSRGS